MILLLLRVVQIHKVLRIFALRKEFGVVWARKIDSEYNVAKVESDNFASSCFMIQCTF